MCVTECLNKFVVITVLYFNEVGWFSEKSYPLLVRSIDDRQVSIVIAASLLRLMPSLSVGEKFVPLPSYFDNVSIASLCSVNIKNIINLIVTIFTAKIFFQLQINSNDSFIS